MLLVITLGIDSNYKDGHVPHRSWNSLKEYSLESTVKDNDLYPVSYLEIKRMEHCWSEIDSFLIWAAIKGCRSHELELSYHH